jgi:hypothetical protein
MMIQRVILAEYEKIVAGSDPVPTARSPSERLRAVEQLKNDDLINEEESKGYFGRTLVARNPR